METNNVETKALTIIEQAKQVSITNAATYSFAGALWKEIRGMMKEVSEAFDPIIEANHAAHKAAVAKKQSFYSPLETASKQLKSVMGEYDAEQERIRQVEQNRLREIALKEEQERLRQESLKAAQEGEFAKASMLASQPAFVPPVVIPKETPKVSGMSFRTVWKFRITDVAAIPSEYMTPDEVKIGQVVRALKGGCKINGVEVYEERV